ncbi:MAG: hypothetical protein LBG23_04800 [Endomicrobium sp.]|jgi:hypothetical protein|nr:hypothetical protein [Endomicrobium sp.]
MQNYEKDNFFIIALTFLILSSAEIYASLTATQDLYNIGPEGRTVEDLTNFAKKAKRYVFYSSK